MKKLIFLIPVIVLVMIAGVAFSKPQPGERPAEFTEKRMFESFPHSNLRLGLVLTDAEPGTGKAGVGVQRIVPGSPAEDAGLREGDVILSMDGRAVANPRDVREFIKDMDEPKAIEMQVERDGQPMTITVTPEKRDLMAYAFAGNRMYLGLNLQELDKDLAGYFQVDPAAGVLVTRVEPESPAEKAGVRSGDVITHINGTKINESSDVLKQTRDLEEGSTVEITILRHGSEKKFVATPEKRAGGFDGNFPEIQRMMRSPEFQSDMEELRGEVDRLKDDLQLRKEDMRKMRDEIRENIQKEMEKLRKELKENKEQM